VLMGAAFCVPVSLFEIVAGSRIKNRPHFRAAATGTAQNGSVIKTFPPPVG
jgi:hypothetical protein